jgi:hypothetical protein
MRLQVINASKNKGKTFGAFILCFWTSTAALFAQPNPVSSTPGGVLTSASSSSTPRPMIDPNILLLNAIQQAVWGPPIACKVYQQSVAFHQQVIVSGEYKAAGGGTGQFRFTTRTSSGETTLDTIQVSDGRLMVTQVGSKTPPRIVNVERVRESLAQKIHRPQDHPELSINLAIGGQPELLRCLYQRYHWYRAVEGKISGIDVWQLFGKLRTEPPKVSGNAKLDAQNLSMPIGESEEMPSHVRLILGRSQTLPYFPFLVDYFRLKRDTEGRAIGFEPVSKIEYSEPTNRVQISEGDFVYRTDATTDRIVWETDLYLP